MRFRLSKIARQMGAVAKDAVFPIRCCGCERLFRREETGSKGNRVSHKEDWGPLNPLADCLCDACMREVETVQSPLCTHCGRPFDSPEGVDHICGNCQQEPFDFEMARSAGVYGKALKTLIHLYKYRFRSELALPLSMMLWNVLTRYWDPHEMDFIIPVPLHGRRLRDRGFNQADLLIRKWPALARAQGRCLSTEKMPAGMLVRCRRTPPQTGLDRGQRIANLQHAFKLNDASAVRGRRILLVDDVLTTGATVNACARVLKKAKAATVRVLTLARAVYPY